KKDLFHDSDLEDTLNTQVINFRPGITAHIDTPARGIVAIPVDVRIITTILGDGHQVVHRRKHPHALYKIHARMNIIAHGDIPQPDIGTVLDKPPAKVKGAPVLLLGLRSLRILPVRERPPVIPHLLRDVIEAADVRKEIRIHIDDIVPIHPLDQKVHVETLPAKAIGKAISELRIHIPDQLLILGGNGPVMIQVLIPDLPHSTPDDGITLIRHHGIGPHFRLIAIDILLHIAIQRTYGLPYLLNKRLVAIGIDARGELFRHTTAQRHDLVPVKGDIRAKIPVEVLRRYRYRRNRQLQALVSDLPAVDQLRTETRGRRDRNVLQQVMRPFIIDIAMERDPVLQKSQIQTRVILIRGLPLQIRITRSRIVVVGIAVRKRAVKSIRIGDQLRQRHIGTHALVARAAIAHPQLGVAHRAQQTLEKGLVRKMPGKSTAGKLRPTVARLELARTIVTEAQR